MIPWNHIKYILDKCGGNQAKALFYVRETIENNWSRAVLLNFLGTDLYERKGNSITNFEATLPRDGGDLARQMTKDPYNFDFLVLREEYDEKELKSATVEVSKQDAVRAINIALLRRNHLIGKRIDEEILSTRANDYGKSIIKKLSAFLTERFGSGFDKSSLYTYVRFYRLFPKHFRLAESKILSIVDPLSRADPRRQRCGKALLRKGGACLWLERTRPAAGDP